MKIRYDKKLKRWILTSEEFAHVVDHAIERGKREERERILKNIGVQGQGEKTTYLMTTKKFWASLTRKDSQGK